MKINFITTNTLKFEIAKAFFDQHTEEFELVQYAVDTPEIQSDSVEKIAEQSALWATKEIGEPCIKLDVGFFIESLGGFPGPFVKYVNDWLSQDDILRLMQGQTDRTAYFKDALAFVKPDGSVKVFTSKASGSLAMQADINNTKWTMNSLFIPDGYTKTLGSMSDAEQNDYWRDGIWTQLVDYLSTST